MSLGGGPVTSNYPQGFANGVTVRGIPLLQAQCGQVFWLNNSTVLLPGQAAGSDSNRGTYQRPFATLQGALNSGSTSNTSGVGVVSGRGDIIMVGAGHAETISTATALTLSQNGVAIIGMGAGSLRPTFTIAGGTASTINVTAPNVSIQNCIFVANYAAIVSLFTMTTATDFAVDNCEFKDTSSILNFLNYFSCGTTDNSVDGLSVTRCRFANLTATASVSLFNPTCTNDRMTFADNFYMAATTAATAVFPFASTKYATNWQVRRNIFKLVNASGTGTGLIFITGGVSTFTGIYDQNTSFSLATTALLMTTGSGLMIGQNWHTHTPDKTPQYLPTQSS